MVFTIEPVFSLDCIPEIMYQAQDGFSICMPFIPSVQWEHQIYVGKDGPQVLTLRENEDLEKYCKNRKKRVLMPLFDGYDENEVTELEKALIGKGVQVIRSQFSVDGSQKSDLFLNQEFDFDGFLETGGKENIRKCENYGPLLTRKTQLMESKSGFLVVNTSKDKSIEDILKLF